MPRNLILAIAIILLGILSFDLMGVLVRMLGGTYPIFQISVLRNFFGLLPSAFLLWQAKKFTSLKGLNTRRFHLINLCRSLSVVTAQFSFYTSLTKIEFATASALCFAGPMFITALSVPILQHKIGVWRWGAVIIGFAGVLTILQPFDQGFSPYMLLPVLAAFCYATSSVLVRLYPAEMPSAAIQFGQQIGTCLLAIILLFIFAEPVAITSFSDVSLFVLLGIFGGTGVMCLVIAYRLVDPSSISPFEYFGIPVSFFLGWLFFAEAPFGDLFPGILFLVAAGIIIMLRERRLSRRPAVQKVGD
jgi:drug/metabolite transporter (DMT)-like permease